ncbi:DUF4231 domain-containing protein [Paenibacillus nuruki]|uniref:DUF4231 domain-containing protein n=1 Tax=Paenibacillus nuruki TaxID=1886670 RepID=UPI0028063240|nr:DUF4231 domain-containing protein [Paenibacillus nuruki]CAJ1315885.1 hypothetical protein AASFL403_11730 [Paenibacillus nuruki]
MNEYDYMKDRLEQQMKWYDDTSKSAQKTYKWLKRIELIAAGLIPVLSIISPDNIFLIFIIAFLGATVLAMEGFISIGKYYEIWTSYRDTCEMLKREKHLFLTRVNPYNNEDNFFLLVERVEEILAQEKNSWINLHKDKKSNPDENSN